VPDTLGGAGVQFFPKDLEYAAELLGSLAFDDRLRARVIAGQRRRLKDFGDARIIRALESIADNHPPVTAEDTEDAEGKTLRHSPRPPRPPQK
jgi:hypothetical protein